MRLDSQSNDLLRLAFDLSPAGMLVVDDSGTILLVNREIERLFGYSREELIGKPVDLLVPDRAQTHHPTFRSRYAADPSTRPMGMGRDLFGRRKDGTEVPVEIGLNPIRSEQGLLVLGTVVDITARRAIEAQLRQAQKMDAMGTLASGIAHDFNNVLHGIVGHAELVRRDPAITPESAGDLDQILKVVARGRQIVDRVLTFSRQREASATRVRLERPVREALDLLRVSLPREIEIRDALDASTPSVRCDEAQIHQIVVNLGTNSAHAMERGGVLEVRLEPFQASAEFVAEHGGLEPGLCARITVVDTGSGMPPEILERAFEPFFTTKPPGRGTGLGLSMIHGIVQSLRGTIHVASQVGHGTRVDIVLPARPDRAISAPSTAAPSGSAAWPHVLVVEDEADLATMLRRQLESFHYRATVHTSSLEALDDFRSRPDAFDALMTDNSMPRMPGLQLAGEMKKIRPELPILLVSGTAASTDPAELKRIGITGVLRKPHTGQEMDEALKAVLRRG